MSAPTYKPGRVIKTVPGAVAMVVRGRPLYYGTQLLRPRYFLFSPLSWIRWAVEREKLRAAVKLPTTTEVKPSKPWPKAPEATKTGGGDAP